MTSAAHKYTLSILVENKPSSLTRITGLFARRAFNIHSLAVGPTQIDDVSRVTIVTDETTAPVEQIVNQLRRLIYVLKVTVMDSNTSVNREIILVKVAADSSVVAERTAVLEVANLFRTKVVDVTPTSLTIEATGSATKLHGFIEALKPYNILEIVKSGTIAISRGPDTLEEAHSLGEA
ncbi:MAG: acetolactate synthase small subunit [Candidatus Ancillula sp.]|jgi:acetolactate synthase-1/3 small subunit|nr:acetolactate synthase small subunit [Candidatus Ancillula sp.]